MKKLAFDIGGTFTDFVYQDGTATHILKVPTTPDDPAAGVLAGLAQLENAAGLGVAELAHEDAHLLPETVNNRTLEK